jgi:hypothetical protein
MGYHGWIGCEYKPRAGTVPGLGWFARYVAAKATREENRMSSGVVARSREGRPTSSSLDIPRGP